MVTAERVRELLDYDPETGVFRWRVGRRGVSVGGIAGTRKGRRYRQITIDRRAYGAHCLAWLYVTGEWPKDEIDHRSTDSGDDRFENLRPATRMQNGSNRRLGKNNTSGFKGVSRLRGRKKQWQAGIMVAGKSISLGHFNTAEEAHAAYVAAAEKHFGEFARSA